MAVKPIIDVEINDSAFARFYELFQQYHEEIGEQPEKWRELNGVMEETTRGLETGALSAKEALAMAAAQAGIIAEAIRNAADAQKDLDSSARTSGASMQGLSKHVQGLSFSLGGLKSALGLLPGWGKLAAIGVAGFAGAVDLANTAFTRYRAAGSLGLSTGQLASFGVNAQQFLGTGSIENAANAQADLSKAGWLAALGIGYDKATSMSSSDLAFAELKNAAKAYRSNPHDYLQTVQGRAYLELGGNLDDVRNAAAHLGELNKAWFRTHRDAQSLNISDTDAQKLTDFKISVDRAKATIDTTLINGLAPVSPALTKLADGATDAAKALDGPGGLVEAVHDAAFAIRHPREAAEKLEANKEAFNIALGAEGPGGPILEAVAKGAEWAYEHFFRRGTPSHASSGVGGSQRAILDAISGQESGNTYNGPDSPTGARGRYQFEPYTAAAYLPDWFKKTYGSDISKGAAATAWSQNTRGVQDTVARGYYDMLNAHARKLGKPNNDAASIAAGWYGGVGGEDAWIRQDRAALNRPQYGGPSIAEYVREVLARERRAMEHEHRASEASARASAPKPARRAVRAPSPVHVSVTNTTAARIAVSLNAVAVPQ